MSSSSKRQTTMAKLARERSVRERRERKQEKKDERKLAAAEGRDVALTGSEDEAPLLESDHEAPAVDDETAAEDVAAREREITP